jgi:hypothetical protein
MFAGINCTDLVHRNVFTLSRRASTQSSTQRSLTQRSSAQRASSQSSTGGTTCRLCAKRLSASEEDERDNEHR